MEPQKKPAKSLSYRERVKAGLQKPWGADKPRKKIKPMSKKESGRMARYRSMLEKWWADPNNCKCARCGALSQLTPHHPRRRLGENLYYFITVCVTCHEWIENNKKQAKRKDGTKHHDRRAIQGIDGGGG